jgi:hypothetical protein
MLSDESWAPASAATDASVVVETAAMPTGRIGAGFTRADGLRLACASGRLSADTSTVTERLLDRGKWTEGRCPVEASA